MSLVIRRNSTRTYLSILERILFSNMLKYFGYSIWHYKISGYFLFYIIFFVNGSITLRFFYSNHQLSVLTDLLKTSEENSPWNTLHPFHLLFSTIKDHLESPINAFTFSYNKKFNLISQNFEIYDIFFLAIDMDKTWIFDEFH